MEVKQNGIYISEGIYREMESPIGYSKYFEYHFYYFKP